MFQHPLPQSPLFFTKGRVYHIHKNHGRAVIGRGQVWNTKCTLCSTWNDQMGAIELRRVDAARCSCRGSILEAWFRTAWKPCGKITKDTYVYNVCICINVYKYTHTNRHAVGIICLLWNPWFCSGNSFRLPPAKEDALESKSLERRCCLKSREPKQSENQFQRLGRAKTTC